VRRHDLHLRVVERVEHVALQLGEHRLAGTGTAALSLTLDRKLFRTEVGIALSGGSFTTSSLDVSSGALNTVRASGVELRGVVTYSSTLKL
jgi:hypothetical protein